MKFFNIKKATSNTTTLATATKAAAQTARRVETAKNILAVYGGVRLALDVVNAIKVARLIKAGKIAQAEDGYWYYTDSQSEEEEGGVEEEEAQ